MADFEITRRDALRLIKYFGVATAVWWAKSIAEQLAAVQRLYTEPLIRRCAVAALGPTDDVKALVAKLFLGTRDNVYLVPAQNNPLVCEDPAILTLHPKEAFTHTTLEAAEAFGGILDKFDDPIRQVDQLIRLNAEGNLITFGSPTSNLIARMAMRYAEIGDGKQGCEYMPSDALSLSIRYELDGNSILVSGLPNRTISGRGKRAVYEAPNWGIRRHNGALLLPNALNGTLVEDYLLISSLPNILNPHALEAGHRIINFGGTHKEGTAAVRQLIQSKELLQELDEQLSSIITNRGEMPYWQALVVVECDPKSGDVKPVHVREVHEVQVDARRLHDFAIENCRLLRERI